MKALISTALNVELIVVAPSKWEGKQVSFKKDVYPQLSVRRPADVALNLRSGRIKPVCSGRNMIFLWIRLL